MSKKIKSLIVSLGFAVALLCSISVGAQDASLDEGPVVGAKNCVCKGGDSCESSAFVSFRKPCGKEPCGGSGSGSNIPGMPTTVVIVCS